MPLSNQTLESLRTELSSERTELLEEQARTRRTEDPAARSELDKLCHAVDQWERDAEACDSTGDEDKLVELKERARDLGMRMADLRSRPDG